MSISRSHQATARLSHTLASIRCATTHSPSSTYKKPTSYTYFKKPISTSSPAAAAAPRKAASPSYPPKASAASPSASYSAPSSSDFGFDEITSSSFASQPTRSAPSLSNPPSQFQSPSAEVSTPPYPTSGQPSYSSSYGGSLEGMNIPPPPLQSFPDESYTSLPEVMGGPPGEVQGGWDTSFSGLSFQPFPTEVAKVLMRDLEPGEIEVKPGE